MGLNREWFYRLYAHAKATGGQPLLVAEIERADPSMKLRNDLEAELDRFPPVKALTPQPRLIK